MQRIESLLLKFSAFMFMFAALCFMLPHTVYAVDYEISGEYEIFRRYYNSDGTYRDQCEYWMRIDDTLPGEDPASNVVLCIKNTGEKAITNLKITKYDNNNHFRLDKDHIDSIAPGKEEEIRITAAKTSGCEDYKADLEFTCDAANACHIYLTEGVFHLIHSVKKTPEAPKGLAAIYRYYKDDGTYEEFDASYLSDSKSFNNGYVYINSTLVGKEPESSASIFIKNYGDTAVENIDITYDEDYEFNAVDHFTLSKTHIDSIAPDGEDEIIITPKKSDVSKSYVARLKVGNDIAFFVKHRTYNNDISLNMPEEQSAVIGSDYSYIPTPQGDNAKSVYRWKISVDGDDDKNTKLIALYNDMKAAGLLSNGFKFIGNQPAACYQYADAPTPDGDKFILLKHGVNQIGYDDLWCNFGYDSSWVHDNSPLLLCGKMKASGKFDFNLTVECFDSFHFLGMEAFNHGNILHKTCSKTIPISIDVAKATIRAKDLCYGLYDESGNHIKDSNGAWAENPNAKIIFNDGTDGSDDIDEYREYHSVSELQFNPVDMGYKDKIDYSLMLLGPRTSVPISVKAELSGTDKDCFEISYPKDTDKIRVNRTEDDEDNYDNFKITIKLKDSSVLNEARKYKANLVVSGDMINTLTVPISATVKGDASLQLKVREKWEDTDTWDDMRDIKNGEEIQIGYTVSGMDPIKSRKLVMVLKNSGSEQVGDVKIELSNGTETNNPKDHFIVDKPLIGSMASGDEAEVIIRPVKSDQPGTYIATVTVSVGSTNVCTFNIMTWVSKKIELVPPTQTTVGIGGRYSYTPIAKNAGSALWTITVDDDDDKNTKLIKLYDDMQAAGFSWKDAHAERPTPDGAKEIRVIADEDDMSERPNSFFDIDSVKSFGTFNYNLSVRSVGNGYGDDSRNTDTIPMTLTVTKNKHVHFGDDPYRNDDENYVGLITKRKVVINDNEYDHYYDYDSQYGPEYDPSSYYETSAYAFKPVQKDFDTARNGDIQATLNLCGPALCLAGAKVELTGEDKDYFEIIQPDDPNSLTGNISEVTFKLKDTAIKGEIREYNANLMLSGDLFETVTLPISAKITDGKNNDDTDETGELKAAFVDGKTDYTYTGAKITPEVIVTNGSKVLVAGTDYKVSYKDNINVGKDAQAIITGKGLYSNSIVLKFAINKKNIGDSDVYVGGLTVKEGTPDKKIKLTLVYKGMVLKQGTDYEIEFGSASGNVRTASIKAKGDKYSDAKPITITYEKAAATLKATILKTDYVYDGKSKDLLADKKIKVAGIDDKDLSSKVHVAYSNNIDAGTCKVTIVADGYTGIVSGSFKIAPAKAVKLAVTNLTALETTGEKYKNTGVKPNVAIKVSDASSPLNETELVLGKDYTIKYSKNKDVGYKTGVAKITYYGNYKGNTTLKSVNFSIVPALLTDEATKVEVCMPKTIVFDPKKPAGSNYFLKQGNNFVVTVDGVLLNNNEYGVEYLNVADNSKIEKKTVLSVGTEIKVKITPKGKNTQKYGNVSYVTTDTYKLIAAKEVNLGEGKIRIADPANPQKTAKIGYTGSKIELGLNKEDAAKNNKQGYLELKIGNETVNLNDSDFDIVYANNVSKGKATVIISAKPGSTKFSGYTMTTFKIDAHRF